MVECEHGFIEHQNGIVDSQVVGAPIRNVLYCPDHFVTKVTDSAACKGRKIGYADGMESCHCRAKVLDKIGGLSVAIALDQKRISAQKGVPGDSLAAFDTLQQESIRAVFLQLQKCRDGRQEISNDRLIDRNDISLRLEFFNFFQAWLHFFSLSIRDGSRPA